METLALLEDSGILWDRRPGELIRGTERWVVAVSVTRALIERELVIGTSNGAYVMSEKGRNALELYRMFKNSPERRMGCGCRIGSHPDHRNPEILWSEDTCKLGWRPA